MSLFCRGFQFFYISLFILELKANFTVRRHISVFLLFLLLLTGVMRKEKGGKRGRKKMDEREKGSEERTEERSKERTEERSEERTEERTDLLEDTEATEEACEEYKRSEDDPECHSSAKSFMTRNIHFSMTGTEERLSGQKSLQN